MLRNMAFTPKTVCSSMVNFISFRTYYQSSTPPVEPSPVSDSRTVDSDEILRFKNLSETWWNELGSMKALHAMNGLRVPFVRDGLINNEKVQKEVISSAKPLMNLDILDVGCGGGILTESLARLGANVTGLDACEDLIKCAKLHSNSDPEICNNIKYVYSTVEDFSSGENIEKFDAVVASEILEHVHSRELFLKSCIGTLKPGGLIFITTINKTTLSWLGGIIAAEYLFGIVPKGTHNWEKFVAPHEVQKLLENCNCQTKVIHGMFYNLIQNKWHWIRNTSTCYALYATKNIEKN